MTHSFDTDIAKAVGVNAAVIYNSIFWWCAKHRADGTNHHNGNWWVFNSRKAWCAQFPYMSEKTIQTALEKLVGSGLVLKGNYNEDKMNRTCWYAIGDISRLTTSGQWLTDNGQCIDQNRSMIYNISTNNISTKIEKKNNAPAREEIELDQRWCELMMMHNQGLEADDVPPLVEWSRDQLVLQGESASRGDVLRYASKNVRRYLEHKRVETVKAMDMNERRMAFWELSQQYVGKFSQNLRDRFVLYYTKPSDKIEGLMRFEETREFDMLSTLNQWKKRDEQRDKHDPA